VPISSFDDKFVTLSELDLSKIFWRDPSLKCRMQTLAVECFETIQYADQVSQADVADWLTGAPPGEFITKLLTDIGGYSKEERRRLRNYSRTTFLMPLEEMRAHLHHIRADSFQPAAYAGRGYVLRGSIRTDGFRLQAIAFKLNELHCVKYRRLHPDKLLSGATRLQSTLGGTDYFLTEIRNVIETKQDVEGLWGCDPHLIKILGIDLGQAFVVGASAILPPSEQPSVEIGQELDDAIMEPSPPTIEEVEGSGVSKTEKPPPKYFNLACKQKAVYQPTFKHRRWLEQRKGQSREGGESISHIETCLPARRGPEASIKDYAARVEEVKDDLDSFYGSVVLKKHRWNARKARTEEYRLIANRLLQLVGGSLGARREIKDKVIIGVGLGQFSSKTRLSSLHESFQSYFVQKVSDPSPCLVFTNLPSMPKQLWLIYICCFYILSRRVPSVTSLLVSMNTTRQRNAQRAQSLLVKLTSVVSIVQSARNTCTATSWLATTLPMSFKDTCSTSSDLTTSSPWTLMETIPGSKTDAALRPVLGGLVGLGESNERRMRGQSQVS